MNKKITKLLITAALITGSAETVAMNNMSCPSAAEIHTAQYQTNFAPAFFIYTLHNNMVIVSIPPTNANPNPTQADAQQLLNATTAPYPNSAGEPCFYAPNADQKTEAMPFVMWSDQKPSFMK
ncbi:MAG: hypothetical protein Q8L78_06265 [Coxiellaceae bacterium]|nr:hypothetical protein [Coxiellaceae bacterium]